ncbi:hypothetical protein HUW51_11865 [Adhaeribacter swui]|uniref:PH domain-containing protein n=1 Tax=Adhaeribacter swui TaxID=2086471 RepID=A0A7G7G899_9BACT|nr:hypothetical protein [Adhaeribacter swui]QNF33383.1 hypothetical protein HUW51_11865 [Adhaeribacter swui]
MKENLSNHFKALLSFFIITALSFIILVWANFDEDFVFIFSIGYCIDVLPALYLHIEYYIRNLGEEYRVSENELVHYKDSTAKRCKNSDIERIIVYMSPSIYKGSNLHFLAIESYYYARILTKAGEELIITCLLTPNLELALKRLQGVQFERRKGLFNSIA